MEVQLSKAREGLSHLFAVALDGSFHPLDFISLTTAVQ